MPDRAFRGLAGVDMRSGPEAQISAVAPILPDSSGPAQTVPAPKSGIFDEGYYHLPNVRQDVRVRVPGNRDRGMAEPCRRRLGGNTARARTAQSRRARVDSRTTNETGTTSLIGLTKPGRLMPPCPIWSASSRTARRPICRFGTEIVVSGGLRRLDS